MAINIQSTRLSLMSPENYREATVDCLVDLFSCRVHQVRTAGESNSIFDNLLSLLPE